MKNKLHIAVLLGILALVAFSTCKKDPAVNIETFEITKENKTVGSKTVNIMGTYSYSGKIESMEVFVADNEFFSNVTTHPVVLEGKNFTVDITSLQEATTYHYYYSVDYGFANPYRTETRTFTTESEKPEVVVLEALSLDSTTYRIKCEVLSDGGQEVTERGIWYNTYGDPTMDDETLPHAQGGLGQYTIRMEDLALGKRYYVRAYARNAKGYGYSEVLDFVTEAPQGTSVEIELACNPEEGGTVTGGGTYEIGTRCTVTATANTGYTFVNWTENGTQVSSDAQYTFDVTTGRSLEANFTRQAYVITAQVDPEDSGTVTGAGGYNHGEECTLTATANTGYSFEKWTRGSTTVTTEASCTFTVTTSATYVAHFKVKSYTVSVSAEPSNGGTVTGGGSINYGQTCTVHATPAEGYAFASWTDNGDEVSSEADYTFTVTSNRTLVANFTELQPDEFNITVSANPSEGGTVSGGGTYQEGQRCTVNATSKPGFNFLNWTENGTQVSDLAEYPFTVTGNRVLVANFEAVAPTEYIVSVSASPSNGGTVTGGGTYEQGQQCTVTATANEGYTFANWTEGGDVVSPHPSYTFAVNSNRTLVANFTQQSYAINASANPSAGGTVAGAGTYNHGQSCTLSATAANGYTFTDWTENGTQVSTNPEYTFNVTGNRTLVAQFQVNSYTITASANPTAGGTATVSGNGTFTYNQSCTVSATPATGYTFLRWTENGTQVSTDASYTFDVTGNRTLVAQFQQNTYTISVSGSPSAGGSPYVGSTPGNTSGTYTNGQSCTVHANPATGYAFANWTENGSVVSSEANHAFTVSADRTLVANFSVSGSTGWAEWVSVSVMTGDGNSPAGATVSFLNHNSQEQQNYPMEPIMIDETGYFMWDSFRRGDYKVTVTKAGYETIIDEVGIWEDNYSMSYTLNPTASVPQGAINGQFTINANGDQVYFSKGNLQYIGSASTPYWKFAHNQWDVLGTTTGQNSSNQNVDRDLFGWGTSGWNNGNTYYRPWDTDNSDASLYGPLGNYNLTGSYANSDWGYYNPISNGGDQANQWRTLTIPEWAYIFNTRTTSSGIRYAKAKVNDMDGVILLPDDWSTSYYSLSNTNQGTASYSSNVISSTQWSTLEQHGAVFLPAAGFRDGTSVGGVGSFGYYWSASYDLSSSAYYVFFNDSNLSPQISYNRCSGRSVRLVRSAQ